MQTTLNNWIKTEEETEEKISLKFCDQLNLCDTQEEAEELVHIWCD